MAPIIRHGMRSSSDTGSWTCGCTAVNNPTSYLLFTLPNFFCKCGQEFTGRFRCSFDDIKVNSYYLLGKIHYQKAPHCVAYAYVHALQFKERLEAVIMKQDPSLLEDLDPEKLFEMYKDRCSSMIEKGCPTPTKPIRNARMVHIGLILKEVGLEDQRPEPNNVHKVGDVMVIPRNDFWRITAALADGHALVTSFYSGKRLGRLKYGQLYKPYCPRKYHNNDKKKIVGHAVCLIGAGRDKDNGEKYLEFVNSHRRFCRRRNSRGRIIKSGIGRIRASDLKCNVICLHRVATPEDEWKLQPQNEIVLNDHNYRLMTRLMPQVTENLDADDGMEVEDLDSYMKVPHDWIPTEIKPYTSGKWLFDGTARGQFLVHDSTSGEVYWNDAKQAMSEPVYQKQYCTSSFIQWSPLGTHLTTVDRQGAQVWGGYDKFVHLICFTHQQVKLIDFSPGERYLVTYSSHEPSNPRHTPGVILNIFDVRTGNVMLDYKERMDDFASRGNVGVSGISWPIFSWGGGRDDNGFRIWSFDGKQIYKVSKDNLYQFHWRPRPRSSLLGPEKEISTEPPEVEEQGAGTRGSGCVQQLTSRAGADGMGACRHRRRKTIKLRRWFKWLW